MFDGGTIRFVFSFGLACCVVLAMLVAGLKVTGFPERQQRRELGAHEVDLLSEFEQRELRGLLEDRRLPQPPESVPLAELPRLEFPATDP
ncbi:MAG TPA: hypothetical protein VGC50_00410 [Gammaproteobacteria bacterium]|jgi:hypothetical protein